MLWAIEEYAVDTFVLTSSDSLTLEHMLQLGQEFEARRVGLIRYSGLRRRLRPRIHMRPVTNLPLIHIDYPRFVGRAQFSRRMSDILSSRGLIVVLSQLLLVLLVLLARIGLGGPPSRMLKFRSMAVDAEARLADLMNQTDCNGVLFKLENDPRITRAGRGDAQVLA